MLQKNRFILFLPLIILVACGGPAKPVIKPDLEVKPLAASQLPDLPGISIARHPGPADYSSINPHPISVPKYDPNSIDSFQIDFRSSNLMDLDLSESMAILNFANFDSQTKWPPPNKLPAGFSVQQTMELGKDPGLGIKTLHEKGITGRGVGIAIIDMTLLVDHQEFVNQIRVYEEAEDVKANWLASMHGPAVASIAVGKTLGVAPEADLYFIATGDCGGASSIQDLDFSCRAKAIRRIVEINKTLPAKRKIRVLSMAFGWVPESTGYEEITSAVEEAKSAGIFVISSSISETYGFHFNGLGRDPQIDPNRFEAFLPGSWWAQQFFDGKITLDQTLLVPMDARTTASPTCINDYAFYGQGGWSWSIPYLAGMYALAWQVNPGITPQEFWSIALQTGRTIQIQHDGRQYSFGVILDPQALIATIQK
jgi:hypothetical protein